MNRREYLRVSFLTIVTSVIAACRKDVGKYPIIKKLIIINTVPDKAFSGDVLKVLWQSENIKLVSVYTKIDNNDWELKAENIDAKENEFTIPLPLIFSSTGTLSVKITADELETVKTGIITQNSFLIETSVHTELFSIGGIKNLNMNGNDVFVKRETATSIKCFSSSCTHSGCPISFLQSSNKFNCSCHGSQFDIDGNVLQGPAATPLNTFVCETLGAEKFRVFY